MLAVSTKHSALAYHKKLIKKALLDFSSHELAHKEYFSPDAALSCV